MPPEFIPGTIGLAFAVVIAPVAWLLGRWELHRAAPRYVPVADFFEPSKAEVDERFAAIVAQLRAEADQRICDAHQRDAREAQHFDTTIREERTDG